MILKRLADSGFIAATDLIRVVSYNHARRLNVDDSLKPYYATLNEHDDDGVNVIKLRRCSMADLVAYRVVVTTALTAGNFMDSQCMMHYFTHALVDEAGQCSEMEAAIPMALVGPQGKLVLVLFIGLFTYFAHLDCSCIQSRSANILSTTKMLLIISDWWSIANATHLHGSNMQAFGLWSFITEPIARLLRFIARRSGCEYTDDSINNEDRLSPFPSTFMIFSKKHGMTRDWWRNYWSITVHCPAYWTSSISNSTIRNWFHSCQLPKAVRLNFCA